ncbi:MAG TPA: hypothetical protein VG167_19200 [Verrucomicrobiae bacterium]|nr:hypothetical protein [Verrucomicrobiae bacterium]
MALFGGNWDNLEKQLCGGLIGGALFGGTGFLAGGVPDQAFIEGIFGFDTEQIGEDFYEYLNDWK